MKGITEFLYENLNQADEAKIKELEAKVDEARKAAEEAAQANANEGKDDGEESIKDEKSFRDYAENKFKEVFGDELDEKKMKETIDGLINDNKELVEKGEWGEIVGMLNKSFGK